MTTIAQAKTVRIPASRLPLADRIGRRLLRRALPHIESGRLTLVDGEDRLEAGGRAPGPNVELTVLDSSFYSAAALGGSLGAAESYMDGAWRCDDLAGLIELLTVNYEALQTLDGPLARIAMSASRMAYAMQRNSRTGSRRNIKAHYALSNEFFELFLDQSMTYSCGVFERADMSLEEAQVEKIDRTCRKLRLQTSDHLLEIGTGWGSAAIHAASEYGCRVTTTTISDKQFEYASQRVRERGLEDRISIGAVEERGITPHAATPRMKIKGDSEEHHARRRMRRRTRSTSYRASQRLRRFVEPVIGWCKHVGGLARTRFIGHERIQDDAMVVAAAWNLMRMTRLGGAT